MKVKGVTAYNVSRNGVVIQKTFSNNMKDTELVPSATYEYSVQGCDSAGESMVVSDAVSVTMPAAGNTFYCDPINGSMLNDGSQQYPWKTLKEVIDAGLIETWDYEDHPWKEGMKKILVNEGAPVKSGDTIVLMSGDHGRVAIRRAHNKEFINIVAGSGETPVLQEFSLIAGCRWRLSGVTIKRTRDAGENYTSLVTIRGDNWGGDASEIILEGCRILSAEDSETTGWTMSDWDTLPMYGINIGAEKSVVRNNELRNVEFGISADGDMCQITGNSIVNFVSDAYRGNANDILFENNSAINCFAINDNHDDLFQSFSVNGAPPRERIVLRRNRFICNDGSVAPASRPWGQPQGIGCFDGFYLDWIVENNLIVVNHWHGISFYGAANCRITNNTVLLPADCLESNCTPWIHVVNHKDGRPSIYCLVRNNIAMSLGNDSGAAWDHNFELAKSQADYSRLFTNPSSFDFSLNPGTELVDTGSAESAPVIDILEKSRPAGTAHDIGAWERQ